MTPWIDRWLDRGDRALAPSAGIAKVTVLAHADASALAVAVDAVSERFAAHAAAHIDELATRVVSNDGPLDARTVRRLRTALRRLRALVRETSADDAHDHEYDRLARRASKRLGAVRDLDVAIIGIATRRAASGSDLERAALDEIGARLARERDSALERARRRLDAGVLGDIVLGAREHVATFASDPDLEGLAQQWWTATRAALVTALDRARPADDDLDALHEIRIAARRLRYGVECFGPIAPADASAWLDDALALQRAIGTHRDAALLHERLRAEIERATRRGRITLARGLDASVMAARSERARTFVAVRDAIGRARPGGGQPQLRGSDVARSPTRNPPGRSGLT